MGFTAWDSLPKILHPWLGMCPTPESLHQALSPAERSSGTHRGPCFYLRPLKESLGVHGTKIKGEMRGEAITTAWSARGPSSYPRCRGNYRPLVGSDTCQLQELRGRSQSGDCCQDRVLEGAICRAVWVLQAPSPSPGASVWLGLLIASWDFRSQKALALNIVHRIIVSE